MLDELGEIKDAVFYKELISKCGAVQHSGDSRSGKEDGFDEVITIDLQKLDLSINYLSIVINNFSEGGFKGVSNASCKVLGEDNQEYHFIDLDEMKNAGAQDNGILVGTLYRNKCNWYFLNQDLKVPGCWYGDEDCEKMIKQNLLYCKFDS